VLWGRCGRWEAHWLNQLRCLEILQVCFMLNKYWIQIMHIYMKLTSLCVIKVRSTHPWMSSLSFILLNLQDYCCVCCDAVYAGKSAQMIQRILLPPSWWQVRGLLSSSSSSYRQQNFLTTLHITTQKKPSVLSSPWDMQITMSVSQVFYERCSESSIVL
jgi:hypothetical protein